MRKTVAAYGGVAKPLKCLLFLATLFLIATPVSATINLYWTPYFNAESPMSQGGTDYSHYNTSVQLADSVTPNSTPWELFIISGLLSLVLFLYSMRPAKTMDEIESSIIVAAMSFVSAGYCAYSTLNIDRLMGYGVSSQIVNTTTIPPSQSIYNHEYVYMENHMQYSEPAIGLLMVVFMFLIFGYTAYRVSRLKSSILEQESQRGIEE